MTMIQTRKGYMRFCRVGPIKFHKQKGVPHAPANWGIWAFPYPYMDLSYVAQQWMKHMPSHTSLEEWELWIKEHGRKFARPSTFWYSGDLYSHFLPNGEIGVDSGMYDEEPVDWTLMDAMTYARMVRRNRPDSYETWEDMRMKTNIEFTEVFIPRGAGRIRHSTP